MKLALYVGLFYALRSHLGQPALAPPRPEIPGDVNIDVLELPDDASSSTTGVFLTPLIAKGLHKEAQAAAAIAPDIMGARSYAGYLTVDDARRNHLYIWFVPADSPDWAEMPLVLWLQGGPGSSSLYGLFEEIGPFEIEGGNATRREFSWHRRANLLFIDQPVGTGFSYSETDFIHDNGTAAGTDLYEAVVQFHRLFPNFQGGRFFIAGESYAGHYVPVLGHLVHENNPSAAVKVDLTGMMLGNPWSDPATQSDYGEYLYNIGLADEAEEGRLKSLHERFAGFAETGNWPDALEAFAAVGMAWNQYIGQANVYNFVQTGPTLDGDWSQFVENNRIRLHAASKFVPMSDPVFGALKKDQVLSVKPLIEQLLEHYPMVFYSGQLDVICAYPMTATLLRSLDWTGRDGFLQAGRAQWCVDGEHAGYLKRSGNLHEVLVRGAGHMVPHDRPAAALDLFGSVVASPPGSDLFHELQRC